MFTTRASVQKDTLGSFVSAWKALDVGGMASLYAEDLQFVGLPAAVLGGKERTKQQWLDFIRPMWAELSNFKVPSSVSHAQDQCLLKSAIHVNRASFHHNQL
jgi:ketosteroid isomerase-like protein